MRPARTVRGKIIPLHETRIWRRVECLVVRCFDDNGPTVRAFVFHLAVVVAAIGSLGGGGNRWHPIRRERLESASQQQNVVLKAVDGEAEPNLLFGEERKVAIDLRPPELGRWIKRIADQRLIVREIASQYFVANLLETDRELSDELIASFHSAGMRRVDHTRTQVELLEIHTVKGVFRTTTE